MAKVTLTTLAKVSGLTPSGVSKALSAHPDMSESTVKRIRKLAQELDYRPAYFGKALKTGRTQIFALAGYEPGGVSQRAYMPRLFDALMKECHRRDHDLVMLDPLDTWPREGEAMPRIIARGLVDGVLLVAAEPQNPLLQSLAARSIPFIVVDDMHAMPHNALVGDLIYAGQEAVQHLQSCGAQRIIFLESLSERVFKVWSDMHRSMEAACRRARIPFARHEMPLSWYRENGIADVRIHLKQWLEQPEWGTQGPVGVVAGNDSVAQSLLSVALELGVEVPRRLMVIGYSNDMFCEQAYPPLTSFAYQEVMAAQAVDMLCQLVQKKGKKKIPSARFSPQLVIRHSTAGIART